MYVSLLNRCVLIFEDDVFIFIFIFTLFLFFWGGGGGGGSKTVLLESCDQVYCFMNENQFNIAFKMITMET